MAKEDSLKVLEARLGALRLPFYRLCCSARS
jgi:hypothetical protein